MTPHQKMLVQSSFAQVAPVAETAAGLFRGDIEEQGRKLMAMLTVAVNGLDHLDKLVPVVRAMGVRHAGYGVRDDHYETVAVALIWTLETGLGEAFTDEVREAWTAVYWLLAYTMRAGAEDEALAKSA